MFNRYGLRIRSRRFLLEWLGASVAVWPIAAAVATPVLLAALFTVAFIMALSREFMPGLPQSLHEILWGLLAASSVGIVVGGALGGIIGFAQRWLLRRHFAYRLQNFLLGSILGGVAGITATALIGLLLAIEYSPERWLMMIMPLFVTLLAVGQAWSLRRYLHGAWLWVLANLVGGLAFSSALFGEAFGVHVLLNLAAGIALQGGITGVAAVWFLGRLGRSSTPDESAAAWEDEDEADEEAVYDDDEDILLDAPPVQQMRR